MLRLVLGLTCGTNGTVVALRLQGSSRQEAGHTLWTRTLDADFPKVPVESLSTAVVLVSLVSRVTVSSELVAAAATAVTGFTGAEGAICWNSASEAG